MTINEKTGLPYSEDELFSEIFGDPLDDNRQKSYRSEMTFWRGYKVGYCGMCETLTILCPHCGNTSCNGGGCDKCIEDFIDFISKF